MSLINDALKRVKEAQHKAPPSASVGPQLRPVDPVPPAHPGLGLFLPFALVGVALLTLLLVWELSRKDTSPGPVAVRAQGENQEQSLAGNNDSQSASRSSQSVGAPDSSTLQQPSVARATTNSASEPAPKSTPSIASGTNLSAGAQTKISPAPDTVATNGESVGQSTSATAQGTETNPPTAAGAQAPKPAPLKLQGIVFSKRPSAVINGKVLFLGDRIREFRVVAITQESAVLVGGGLTNTLSLPE
jgi:hypothetical protein